MRSRLLVVVSVLVGLLAVGLGVPLAAAGASGETQRLFADRLGDTTRFAALAQRPVADSDLAALTAELERYDELYGITAAVLDPQGRPLARSRPDLPDLVALDVDPGRRVGLALAGQRSEPPPVVWPWDRAPMLLAEPVLVDGEVRAAAVTVSPTDAARVRVLLSWLVLVGAGLLALAVAAAAALPLVRWILAPVERLDVGMSAVDAAVRAGRRAEPVGQGQGRQDRRGRRGPAELRRLTEHFDRMAATVAGTLDAQRAFVADTGHQLRNPLTALRIRLQNLGADLEEPGAGVRETVREEHGAALEEVGRLTEVLDALLALARAEGAPPESVPVALDPVLDERAEAWGVLAEHGGLDLSRGGPRGLVALTDPDTVATVLDAVLDNAVKYAPEGTVVELTTARVEDHVEVSVRDHGRGLAPDELERATDRFWRSPVPPDAGPAPGGTGLGLAIAARSADRGGGALLLHLPEDGGLRVVLRLPAARRPPTTAPQGRPTAP